MPNPDPRYPRRDPREVNPRDPQGGVGSQLNPTRDHVQGEPEGTTPDANQLHGEATAPSPRKRDPDYFDPTKP